MYTIISTSALLNGKNMTQAFICCFLPDIGVKESIFRRSNVYMIMMMSRLEISAGDIEYMRTRREDLRLINQHFTCTLMDAIALH